MSGRDDLPTPEEWAKIKAEWMHDYGLRHMDDCGVKYEDQAERTLDHEAAGPPHPWPSEIAAANRQKQPGREQGKSQEHSHGHDAGHSM